MNLVWLKLTKRILTHKYYVAKYCFQIELYWQGITHDLSKFSFTEFSRAIKYWDDKMSSLANECRILGYSQTFLHHRGRNPHHYEYWIHSLDNAKMPRKYVLELICDYLAAAKTYGAAPRREYTWWLKQQPHMKTKSYITEVFYKYSIGLTLKESINGNY